MAPTISLALHSWCKEGRYHIGEEDSYDVSCNCAPTTVFGAMEGDDDDDDDGYDYAPAAWWDNQLADQWFYLCMNLSTKIEEE